MWKTDRSTGNKYQSQSVGSQSATFVCEKCQRNTPLTQVQTLEGHNICSDCLKKWEVFNQQEDTKEEQVDSKHTIKPNSGVGCSTCGKTNRSLCPCHQACYEHRPVGCKMKRE